VWRSGDGLRCAGGNVLRLKIVNSLSGTSHYPGSGDAPVSVVGSGRRG
jgi:hypothetical protein